MVGVGAVDPGRIERVEVVFGAQRQAVWVSSAMMMALSEGSKVERARWGNWTRGRRHRRPSSAARKSDFVSIVPVPPGMAARWRDSVRRPEVGVDGVVEADGEEA